MPAIARKVVICAAIDGLVIHPLFSKGQKPAAPICIRYGEASISQASRAELPDVSKPNSSFEAFGIVGSFETALVDTVEVLELKSYRFNHYFEVELLDHHHQTTTGCPGIRPSSLRNHRGGRDALHLPKGS